MTESPVYARTTAVEGGGATGSKQTNKHPQNARKASRPVKERKLKGRARFPPISPRRDKPKQRKKRRQFVGHLSQWGALSERDAAPLLFFFLPYCFRISRQEGFTRKNKGVAETETKRKRLKRARPRISERFP